MQQLDWLWSPAPSAVALSSQDVHVWCACLERSPLDLQQLKQTLSPDEIQRASRFHFDRDKHRFIAARGILRNILSRYLGTKPNELQFVYSDRGKPALAEISNNNRICFNLSHSQELAVYAVTSGSDLGVDLEYIRRMTDVEQIVDRFFSENEKAVFRTLPEHQKQAAFFHAWTRKEAYLKATGDGLSGHLDQIEVSLVPGELAKLLSIKGNSQAASHWELHDLTPASGYIGALALQGNDYSIDCWQWLDNC